MRKLVAHYLVLAVLLGCLLLIGLASCVASFPPSRPPDPAALDPVPTDTSRLQPSGPVGYPTVRQPSPTPTLVVVPDTITVLMSQEPDVLLPGAGSSTQAREEVLAALWTDLVMRDDKNEYIPWGAESVPTVDNGGAQFVGDGADKHLEVTFKIKKGLRWQDGDPVTSKDVKFTLELLQNPDFPATERTLALKVADVLTPDDQTAVVQFMSENQAKKAAAEGWKYANKDFYRDYA
ncbi:MAG: ABC transporter substrate-binding protein, partial [Dehalococcoidales bacterium]|nr:ABC transporter substrate-binding protein [Dehalococcoidales bacterium]